MMSVKTLCFWEMIGVVLDVTIEATRNEAGRKGEEGAASFKMDDSLGGVVAWLLRRRQGS